MPKSVSASRKNKVLAKIAFRSYYIQWNFTVSRPG
jgi:hypothetical protein